MNKAELIAAIVTKTDVSKASATRIVTAITETIKEELAKGGDVTLVGFGTFSVKHRSSRMGRNPQTGEEMLIKAAKIPSFKAGKPLKDAVKG